MIDKLNKMVSRVSEDKYFLVFVFTFHMPMCGAIMAENPLLGVFLASTQIPNFVKILNKYNVGELNND